MLIDRIAYRYALSLYQLAEEKKILNEIFQDAQKINNLLKASKDLSVFLKTPVVTHIRKIPILEKIFKPMVNEAMMLFIVTLARKAREELLQHIIKAFIEIYYKRHNITVVELITPKPMDSPVKQDLVAKLEKQLQTKVVLKESIDKDLLGGFQIRIGTALYDVSVQNILRKLRKSFNEKISITT